MSKSIKVSDEVYQTIKQFMGPQESYSHVIERALSVFVALSEASKTLGPAHYLKEKQERR